MSDSILLSVRNLTVHFPVMKGLLRPRQVGVVRAVDGISFDLRKGETLGLVGESGCGKSTTGKAILHLLKADAGQILLDGEETASLSPPAFRQYRRKAQMIFQDPYASLNPRMTVGKIVEEPLIVHGLGDPQERRERVRDLLETVGLEARAARRYPHAFSGGQRQRIGIARALAVQPEFIICDEPVSALDVSVQAQILNLLRHLQQSRGLAYLFIAHDLSVVRYMSDRVAVMYLGKIVETLPSESLGASARHPYTRMLLEAIPVPDPDRPASRPESGPSGEPPDPLRLPTGCRFRSRCPIAVEECTLAEPELRQTAPGSWAACHRAEP
ncbi:MAG: ABC transporter ATP-binding protein [Armatimonadetes bacterium]|nr:ABC transporter ATP-binding protein [Armatimonadota bacterium]